MTIYVSTIANVNSKRTNGRMSEDTLVSTIRTSSNVRQHTERVKNVLADRGKDAIDPKDAEGRTYYGVSRMTVPAILPVVDCPAGTPRKDLAIGVHNGNYVYDVDIGVTPADIPVMLADLARWPHTVLAARSISGEAIWVIVRGPQATSIGGYKGHLAEIRGMLPESVRGHVADGQDDLGRPRFLAHAPDAVQGQGVLIEGLTPAPKAGAGGPTGGGPGPGFPPPLAEDDPVTGPEARLRRDRIRERTRANLMTIELPDGESYGIWIDACFSLVALEIECMAEGLAFDGGEIFTDWTVAKAHASSTKPGRAAAKYETLRRDYRPFRDGAIIDGAEKICSMARGGQQRKAGPKTGPGAPRRTADRRWDEAGTDEAEESGDGKSSPRHGRILIDAGKTSVGLIAALGHLGWDVRTNIRTSRTELKPILTSTQVLARAWMETAPQAPDGWLPVTDPVRDRLSERIAECCQYRAGNGQYYPVCFEPVTFRRAASALSLDRSVDPFRDYLERLRAPDPGPDIWGRLFTHAFGVAPGDYSPEYLAHAGRLMIIPAIARTFHPGCESSTMLTLIGDEGYGKSGTFEALFEEGWREIWFSDNFSCRMLRDDTEVVEHTLGRVLVEIADMAGLSTTEAGALKAGLSRKIESNVRLVWREHPADYKRRFAFVGSANDEGTGVLALAGAHRRFWVVHIPKAGRTRTESAKQAREWIGQHREELWVRGQIEFKESGIDSYLEKGDLVTEHEAQVDESRVTGAGIDGLVDRITDLDPQWLHGENGAGRTIAELLTKIEVWQRPGPDGEPVALGLPEVEAKLAVSPGKQTEMDVAARLKGIGWKHQRTRRGGGKKAKRWVP